MRAPIALLWFVLVVPALFSRGYWDPDEGRYGEVAREMTAGQGLIVPHLAGEIYREKPPLYFWVVSAFQLVGGSTAAVSRLPSALATLVTALLLLSLVGRSHGRPAGAFAAAAFLSSVLVIQLGGWVGIDAMVVMLATLAVYTQDRAVRGGPGASAWRAGMYASLAAIVLSKGAPVVIPVLAIAGYALLRNGPRGLLRKHLLWGLPLVLILLLAWALPAAREAGADYLRGLTLGQAARRLVDSESHQGPVFYYLVVFPVLFLPFSVLLPAAVKTAWQEIKAGGERRVETGRYVLWFVLPFLLFSLISGKRERYILPLFVPAAALVGIAIARSAGGRWFTAMVRAPMVFMLSLLAALGICIAAFPFVFESRIVPRLAGIPPHQLSELVEGIRAGRWVLLAGGLSCVLAALDGIFRRRAEAPVTPMCVALVFLMLAAAGGLLPAADRVKSYEPIVSEARAVAPPGARWGLVALQPGPFCLALGTDRVELIEGPGKRARAASRLSEAPEIVLFAEAPVFRNIERELGEPTRVLARRRVGSREIVAFRRR